MRPLPIILLCAAALAACDTVEPVEPSALVVEAYLDAGAPLPAVTLRRTQPMYGPYPLDSTTAVADATLDLWVDGRHIPYRPDPDDHGTYRPEKLSDERSPPPQAPFVLEAKWRGETVRAAGRIPPAIGIDSARAEVSAAPVRAVLLDSLGIDGPDGTHVKEGYVYTVEVTLWWTTTYPEVGENGDYWIHTRLRPVVQTADAADFFLRPEQLIREREVHRSDADVRRWTGIYAVPVGHPEAPLPRHRLEVYLLRSDRDYALFASSRNAPDRREPRSNVDGALGVVAGISIDSLRMQIGR